MALVRDLAFRLPMQTGADVREVQQALARAGVLNPSGADGIFGPGTRDAVIAFQKMLHARNPAIAVDGIVGRDTWSALFSDRAATDPTGGQMTVPPPLGQSAGEEWREMLTPHVDRLTVPHGAPIGTGSRRWRLTGDGLEIIGEGIPRTSGQPETARRVWRDFRAPIEKNAAAYRVPLELVVATICTESGGNPRECRLEPGYVSDEVTPNRVSPGLMQTLISTAREATQDDSLDRNALLLPENSIRAGTAYLRRQATSKIAVISTKYDPPLVAICYNAGSMREDNSNPWGLHQTRRPPKFHADVFVEFFNDCFTVIADLPPDERPKKQVPSFWTLLNT